MVAQLAFLHIIQYFEIVSDPQEQINLIIFLTAESAITQKKHFLLNLFPTSGLFWLFLSHCSFEHCNKYPNNLYMHMLKHYDEEILRTGISGTESILRFFYKMAFQKNCTYSYFRAFLMYHMPNAGCQFLKVLSISVSDCCFYFHFTDY